MRLSRGTTSIAAFGLGYVLGTTINDRPVRLLRRAAERGRVRVNTLSASASRLAERARRDGERAGERVVDVRPVREVMTPVDETVSPKTPLRDAAALMRRTGVTDVIVVKKQRVRGFVSDRDIAVRAVANGLDPTTTPIADVMTRTDVVARADAPMDEATSLMRSNGLRRLVVVDGRGPVGIVAAGDLESRGARTASRMRRLLSFGR
jgi:CBS domain-containing protein